MALKFKLIFATVLAVTGALALAWIWFSRRPAVYPPGPQSVVTTMSAPALGGSEPSPAPLVGNPPVNFVVAETTADRPAKSKKANRKIAGPKPPIEDPDARAALSLVGADPDAEAYWAAAINDPSLPAEERKDLIEDLNEDGLSDPKKPGPQDLPLILNRLELIDELAPYAMDRVNADAFQEAQKDLLAMLDGRPVQ